MGPLFNKVAPQSECGYILVTWVIHESRLLQMRGMAHEVVHVLHFSWAATKQIQ